jgi:hypothetical protein
MKRITILAVIEVPEHVTRLSDDALLDEATKMLGGVAVTFASVTRGVSPAAVAAGCEANDWPPTERCGEPTDVGGAPCVRAKGHCSPTHWPGPDAYAAARSTETSADKLWTWNWVEGGYNSCLAPNRDVALRKAMEVGAPHPMDDGKMTMGLHVNEATIRVVTAKEMREIDAQYAGMFD